MADKPLRQEATPCTSGASISRGGTRLDDITGPATLDNAQPSQSARQSREVVYRRADTLFKQGRYSEAVSAYKLAIGIHKNPSEKDYDHYAFALFKTGNSKEAEAVLREAVRRYTNNAHLVESLGIFCQRNGKPTQAVLHYNRALQLDPSNEKLMTHLAELQARIEGIVVKQA